MSGITDIRQNATIKGKERAVELFNQFLLHIKHEHSSLDECTEDYLCNISTLNQFSLWLLNTYRQKSSKSNASSESNEKFANDSGLLKSKTALQYLSGISYYSSSLECVCLIIYPTGIYCIPIAYTVYH